jgi:hypothetical protein
VVLEGAELMMRDHDAALQLDPDALPGVQAAGLEVLGEGAPWVLLEGSLDRVERLEVEVLGGVLGRYGVRGELVVAPGAVMIGPAPLVWEGEAGARLVARGQLALQGAEVLNLPVRVEDGGVASLGGARLRVEEEAGPDSGCLVEVLGAGIGALEEATLEALPAGSRPALRGVCLVGQGGSPRLSLAVVRGFGVGVEVDGGEVGGWVVAGVRFEDNLTGLWVKAEAAPRVEGNEFVGRLGRSTTAVRFEVGASPGGAVVGNRFELGRAGQAYHLDPDNWAQPGGTVFGPNVWTQRQPSGYLLSGEQTSALAVLGRATELGPEEALLNDVQVVSELRVREGAALQAWGTPEDVLTLSGVQRPGREFVLAVEGRLEVQGPGVFVTELPLVFEPGSGGALRACSLDGALPGLPLVRIEDAAPSVGGTSQFDGAILTGDNTRAVAGLEIEASAPMCDGEAALCPFVANNRFRSLAVGVRLVGGGALEGVNDFDDANPEGDTVPINVERR